MPPPPQVEEPKKKWRNSKEVHRKTTQYLRVCTVCGDAIEMGYYDPKQIRVSEHIADKSPLFPQGYYRPIELPCGHSAKTAHWKIVHLEPAK